MKMIQLLRASAAAAAVLLLSTASFASGQQKCEISTMRLTDTQTGVALNIHDSNGMPFSAGKYRYYCNCGVTTSDVSVTISSGDVGQTYPMSFEDATQTVRSSQYLALGVASTTVKFSLTPAASPSYSNTIVVSPTGTSCRSQYTVTCTKQPPPTSVSGDPQFVGLRGQNYQIHGVAGEVYSIISDPAVQMNSKFVFLKSGDCPTINGVLQKNTKETNCFAHPGSYLGEIGIKTPNGDRLKLVSGAAKHGFQSVTLNGVQMSIGQNSPLASASAADAGQVTFLSTHAVSVRVGAYALEFDNSDLFINQRVTVVGAWEELASHGLLGQTWRTTTYKNAIKHIEGHVDDYVVAGRDLFGDKFAFNQFNIEAAAAAASHAPPAADPKHLEVESAAAAPAAKREQAPHKAPHKDHSRKPKAAKLPKAL